MKTLLRNQKSFGKAIVPVPGLKKATLVKSVFVIAFLLMQSLSNCVYSQSAASVADHPNTENTPGTFQFETPTGNLLFWKVDFIESLYPGIESRRAINHTTVWHFNADMDIIIFAKNTITSSDFVPLESPYNGHKY